jgi:hypothetical protein
VVTAVVVGAVVVEVDEVDDVDGVVVVVVDVVGGSVVGAPLVVVTTEVDVGAGVAAVSPAAFSAHAATRATPTAPTTQTRLAITPFSLVRTPDRWHRWSLGPSGLLALRPATAT